MNDLNMLLSCFRTKMSAVSCCHVEVDGDYLLVIVAPPAKVLPAEAGRQAGRQASHLDRFDEMGQAAITYRPRAIPLVCYCPCKSQAPSQGPSHWASHS